MPRAGQRRQGGADAGGREGPVRDLPRRQGQAIDAAKVPHPGATGDCTDCHNPHAASQPGLPKTDAVTICTGCHTRHRRPAQEGAFITSRHSRRAAPPATRRTAATTSICCAPRATRCAWSATVPIPAPQKRRGRHLLTIFDGKVKLPEDYYQRTRCRSCRCDMAWAIRWRITPFLTSWIRPIKTKVKTPLSCLVVPPAPCFGAARSAGQGPGQQYGFLRQLPQEQGQHERTRFPREVTGVRDDSAYPSIRPATPNRWFCALAALCSAIPFPAAANKEKDG